MAVSDGSKIRRGLYVQKSTQLKMNEGNSKRPTRSDVVSQVSDLADRKFVMKTLRRETVKFTERLQRSGQHLLSSCLLPKYVRLKYRIIILLLFYMGVKLGLSF